MTHSYCHIYFESRSYLFIQVLQTYVVWCYPTFIQIKGTVCSNSTIYSQINATS